VHAIESVVIEWTHQIREVLKKDSAQPLLEGLNPNPYVEFEFWKVKAQNLECIYEQVTTQTRFVDVFLSYIISYHIISFIVTFRQYIENRLEH